jgi:hypothetical protein
MVSEPFTWMVVVEGAASCFCAQAPSTQSTAALQRVPHLDVNLALLITALH